MKQKHLTETELKALHQERMRLEKAAVDAMITLLTFTESTSVLLPYVRKPGIQEYLVAGPGQEIQQYAARNIR